MDCAVSHRKRERRRARRRRAVEEHGIAAVRIRPGHDAVIVDVSTDGVLIETLYRLLPGATVDLQFDFFAGRITIRGRVLRSAVAALMPWSVVYRGAILFERALEWPPDFDGNRLPAGGETARGRTTQLAEGPTAEADRSRHECHATARTPGTRFG